LAAVRIGVFLQRKAVAAGIETHLDKKQELTGFLRGVWDRDRIYVVW
jgi:hypothetical protein